MECTKLFLFELEKNSDSFAAAVGFQVLFL